MMSECVCADGRAELIRARLAPEVTGKVGMECKEVWISVTLLVGMKRYLKITQESENNSREKSFILPLSWLVWSIWVEKLWWPERWLITLNL